MTSNDELVVPADLADLADSTVALVRRWLAASRTVPVDGSARHLARLLKDPRGLEFAVGFVDGVARPEDLAVAAASLHRLKGIAPRFLPWYMRSAIRIGATVGPTLPGVVVPAARRALRSMIGHLIVDATDVTLGATLARLKANGDRLNLNLLGEAVLGEREAKKRLAGIEKLLHRHDVDYVSIKVSAIASQLSMWAFDETVERVADRLTPLFEFAARASTPKFINLDMEEYRDLDLTIAVFRRILDQPQLQHLSAGIVVQAYLPDAVRALDELTQWAQGRVAAGGAPIKVRVVKGANLAMERVDSAMHGWPLATYSHKQDADTNYKRVLSFALTPKRCEAVHIGVAGHNLFDIAFAWLLAGERGVQERVDVEMLLGMATGQAQAVRETVGRLLLYTPVVHPSEFDAAIAYLIRRLEENASSDNFMSAVFDLADDAVLFDREEHRFRSSLAALDDGVPAPHRTQNRSTEARWPVAVAQDGAHMEPRDNDAGSRNAAPVDKATARFTNEPDTDSALPANRAWGRAILGRVAESDLGATTIAAAQVTQPDVLDALLAKTATAGERWGAQPASVRASVLHRAGESLAGQRAALIEIMAAETGKTIAEADPEVSEAIDFAHYYATCASELEQVPGARFVPARLTVVAPPWNFPVAIPAGSVLAALAAGSAVLIKPAPQSKRCAAVMVEALWRAGVPREVLVLADIAEDGLGQHLIAHPLVDRVILTGSWETASLFRSWRNDLPLLAETSGKNAIIVTPSADYDLAAAEIVKSAFGHAGQKCSAASLVILVGSAGTSPRFKRQLLDAASTMRVGYPDDPMTQMGPVIEPASGKLLTALTELAPGERWALEPKPLDDTGRLWSPGIKTGVTDGSAFHLTEYFGPVLGIMRAINLAEAIHLQNKPTYGLTAGLYTLDPEELRLWLSAVQAGNLYVNRGITGAIVQRQPFGGWKRSAVGAGAKAGGPNYLFALGGWQPAERVPEPGPVADRRTLTKDVQGLLDAAASDLTTSEAQWLRRAAESDDREWEQRFGAVVDVSQVGVERNLFRYRPAHIMMVRIIDDCSLVSALRVLAAGLRAAGSLYVSSGIALPEPVTELLTMHGEVRRESDEQWTARVADPYELPGWGWVAPARRVRLAGDNRQQLSEVASDMARAVKGDPDLAVFANPVTGAGRIELLPFLVEQSIAITAHRFGNPEHLSDGVI